MRNFARSIPPQLSRATATLALGLALTLAAILLFSPASSPAVRAAGVIYVDADASGDASGVDWTNAYTNVQDALTAASSGDEIWVAEGVYYPDEGAGQTDDARTSTFTLTAGVALYGGFAGGETLREQRDWAAHVTVLSGDIDQNDTTDPNGVVTTTAAITGSNAYHVVSSSGLTETARLDGFVVTAGQADSPTNPHYYGGGMYNDNGSSPALSNVTFSGNQADYAGGGMSNRTNSGPTLFSVTFSGNLATYGGGMHNYNSSPTLSNVAFSGNRAAEGGGIYNDGSSPTLSNVTFSGNWAIYGGGMKNQYNSSPALSNVTFSGNWARYPGSGMYNYNNSSPTLVNCIVWGNFYPGQIYNEASPRPPSPTATCRAATREKATSTPTRSLWTPPTATCAWAWDRRPSMPGTTIASPLTSIWMATRAR